MLKALYDYALRHDLTLPAGYINKTVKAYILLDADGRFQNIELGTDEAIPAPDIGSLANGKDKSNVLLEKRSVVIPEEPSAKSTFFLNALKAGGEVEPMLMLCVQALEDTETNAAIRARLDEKKIKAADRISFKVDRNSILESKKVLDWWKTFRQQFQKTDPDAMSVCLITGEPTIPTTTTTPINGLHAVGGHARGDALICFDKNAFCSYGLKKAANAPVSEQAFAAVKAALDKLLEDAPILSGMKFVHWYDRDVEEDVIRTCGDFRDFFEEEEEEEEQSEQERAIEQANQESAARKRANQVVGSAESGERERMLDDVSYYILLLSGVGGRIMIRRYERGNYRDLREKLQQWYDDLELTNAGGTGTLGPCKLTGRLMRLLKYQKADRKPFERLGKELAGITPAVLMAIVTGVQLPDAVASRALAYIRSKMMSDEQATKDLFGQESHVWQWLKVWLVRNKGKGNVLMKNYNPEYPAAAYHCGAMMAIYEAIQNEGMPDVNATLMQRYYASAIQMPALVLGRLSQMSVHHLEKMKKIEKRWLADRYREWLNQTASAIQEKIPATLNLEQQSEFALGYYQMHAELAREKKERMAAKKVRDTANVEKMEG